MHKYTYKLPCWQKTFLIIFPKNVSFALSVARFLTSHQSSNNNSVSMLMYHWAHLFLPWCYLIKCCSTFQHANMKKFPIKSMCNNFWANKHQNKERLAIAHLALMTNFSWTITHCSSWKNDLFFGSTFQIFFACRRLLSSSGDALKQDKSW